MTDQMTCQRPPTISAAFMRSVSSPGVKPAARSKPPVLSIRLSDAERDQLEREAAGETLSAYARRKLFGRTARKGSRRTPISDDKALARVLGAMGKSPQIGTLKGVLRASEEGALVLGGEAEDALRVACTQIEEMRLDLLEALGLRPD